jgi:hypothetical protein
VEQKRKQKTHYPTNLVDYKITLNKKAMKTKIELTQEALDQIKDFELVNADMQIRDYILSGSTNMSTEIDIRVKLSSYVLEAIAGKFGLAKYKEINGVRCLSVRTYYTSANGNSIFITLI